MRKSVLTLSVVLVLVALILAACGGSTTTSGPKTIKTIGMTVQAISNPFFVAMLHGAQAEAKKIGASVLLEDAKHDLGVQTNEMDDFIQIHVVLILLNAVDSAGSHTSRWSALQGRDWRPPIALTHRSFWPLP